MRPRISLYGDNGWVLELPLQKWRWPQKWRQPKNEDNIKNEDDIQNQNNLKNEDDLKKIIWPPDLREYYLKFFWWPLTSTATGQLILNRKCYQVFKTEMELHMINIIYAALPMREQTEYRRSTHGAEHIPGIFSLHAAYSALRHFFMYLQFIKTQNVAPKIFANLKYNNTTTT